MAGISEYAEIALPLAIHETLTYRIPEELRDSVRLGSRVEVPLGPKLTTGFVVGLVDQSSVAAAKVKAIRSLLDDEEPRIAGRRCEVNRILETAIDLFETNRPRRLLRRSGR